MHRFLAVFLVCAVACCFAPALRAGGSGYNVVIVVNQSSTNSVQAGNYYRQLRDVPPQNVLRISWPTNNNVQWALTDFTNTLLGPLVAMLNSRQLTNQIDYIVLSMDIPYRVTDGTNANSTTSALFYGYKTDPSGNGPEIANGSTNLYAASESIFRSTPPISASSNSWMVTMLTSMYLSDVKTMAQQGTSSDGTFPAQTVWLSRSSDYTRNLRFLEFDNTIFDTRLRGNYSVMRTNIESPTFTNLILGYENGSYFYGANAGPMFVPGAMADNLTSFSGQLFEDTAGQTTLLRFVSLGVTGSYGTVCEPYAFPDKFPDSQNYFYQSRGFSLGECYYQSVTNPYQGLIVGEPLAAPFATPASGDWTGLASNATLSGITNLSVHFTAPDATRPVQQIDLFLDGNWLQTLTNIPPHAGDVVNVTIKGFVASYAVPASATIKSVTSNLVNVLNGATYQNNTKVLATAHGDRIELQSTAPFSTTGSQISLAVSSTNTSTTRTTFIRASATNPTNLLDSAADGLREFELVGPMSLALNDTLTLTVTKTNNAVVTVTVTNTMSGNSIGNFSVQLLTAISNSASLQGADGVTASGPETNWTESVFYVQANTPGYAAAQIKSTVTASPQISVFANPGTTLTDNQNDLEPRNHLYITAGTTNLTNTFPFTTTTQPDGYHEIEAVAYEGSHVHTQARATQSIVIKNTSLSATVNTVLTGTNSALQPTLTFTVVANTNTISTIQLFSTGGLLAAVTNQSTGVFALNYANLGVGVHPFYALVTDNSGHQYRTPTQTIGLIGVTNGSATLFGVDYPFNLQVSKPPVTLVWPATAGRAYNVLSTTSLLSPFQVEAVVTPTNSLGQFIETNALSAQQFYRISVTP